MPIVTGPGRPSSGGLVVTAAFELLTLTHVTVPAARRIIAILVNDADFAGIRYQISTDGGTSWKDLATYSGNADVIQVQDQFEPMPLIKSDGTNLRIRNGGINTNSGIQYAYEVAN